jgi:hypothetical protein
LRMMFSTDCAGEIILGTHIVIRIHRLSSPSALLLSR